MSLREEEEFQRRENLQQAENVLKNHSGVQALLLRSGGRITNLKLHEEKK